MNSSIHPIRFLVFCTVLLCVGCRHAPGLEGLVPAEGIVTLNDEPAVEAFLLFRPVGPGQAASGTTGADGRFSLMTFQPGDGARPGEYLVTITKTETCGEIKIERPTGTNQKIVHDDRVIISHLPEKYASPASTDIRITLPENGDTNLKLNLSGDVDATPQKIKDMKRRIYTAERQ